MATMAMNGLSFPPPPERRVLIYRHDHDCRFTRAEGGPIDMHRTIVLGVAKHYERPDYRCADLGVSLLLVSDTYYAEGEYSK